MRHIAKPALSLFVVAALSAVSLGVVYDAMAEPIAENRRRARARMLAEVLPLAPGGGFEALFDRAAGVGPELKAGAQTSDGRISIERIFEGREAGGGAAGFAVELVTGAGYGGPIALVVGISSAEGRISGVRVLRHGETPGFGAVISRESFFRRFDGRALSPIAVVRRAEAAAGEFQAITSSTITTDAVVGAVNEAIAWYGRKSAAGEPRDGGNR